MLFLADENVPLVLIQRLRVLGHDVEWMVTAAPGDDDLDVLNLAHAQSRICITFDKDFGDIAMRRPDLAASGIILLRVPMPPPEEARRLADLIDASPNWAGRISVIGTGRVRVRLLPVPGRPAPS